MVSNYEISKRRHIDDLLAGRWGNGQNNDWFVKDEQKNIARMVEDYKSGQLIIESDGAGRWESSGNYIPDDCAYRAFLGGVPIDLEATCLKRDVQVAEQLAEYRERMKNYIPSAEEMAEMRSAFGEGETVVNVITGQVYQL